MPDLPISASIPGDALDALADLVAEKVAERLPNRPEPYLGVEAAADYLSCKPARIYELVAQGRLHPLRDGRRLLFLRADLDAALDGGPA